MRPRVDEWLRPVWREVSAPRMQDPQWDGAHAGASMLDVVCVCARRSRFVSCTVPRVYCGSVSRSDVELLSGQCGCVTSLRVATSGGAHGRGSV